MRREIILLVVGVVVCLGTVVEAGVYSGGNGDPNTPYLIANADDIIEMSNTSDDWDRYFLMITDVNMIDYTFTTAVIAPDTDSSTNGYQGSAFKGSFNGQGYVIKNFNTSQGSEYIGIFGKIDLNGSITDLGLDNADVSGTGDYIGSLCGINYGNIMNCFASGQVRGKKSVGVLCGGNYGSITNCYTTGEASGISDYIGGLCGWNYFGSVKNCYSTCNVSGNDHIGGLCGNNDGWYDHKGEITNCYTSGYVSGTGNSVGGLCGSNSLNGCITNCYFYHFSGPVNDLGTALDESQLLDETSYIGFDFSDNPEDGTDDNWAIVAGHLPKLNWQADDGPVVPLDSILTTLRGTGYRNNPFVISNAEDLMEFRTNPSLRIGYYLLINDIDLVGKTYFTAFIPESFNGYFDGNGYVVRNLTIDGDHFLGFIGVLHGEVVNIGLEDVSISGTGDYIGGMCGHNVHGSLINCYATGTLNGIGNYVGGLCGRNSEGSLTNCYAINTVSGSQYTGGLCGRNYWGSITDSYANGDVNGITSDVGGLCGNNEHGNIMNCYATGYVSGGGTYVGGLCGNNKHGNIMNCYATGDVSGLGSVGGLCGYNFFVSMLINCCATGNVNGTGAIGGLCGRNEMSGINNCHATGTVTGEIYIGGLCGRSTRGNSITKINIMDCYASGTVSGNKYVGGLCGHNSYGNITTSCAFGTVNGTGDYVGGLCGRNYGSNITNCYATSNVHGGNYVGGLCGESHTDIVTHCYVAGAVTGTGVSIGGLFGEKRAGTLTNCYFLQGAGPDNGYGTSLTDSQMKQQASFAGWDFVSETVNGTEDIWKIADGFDYPRLSWELYPLEVSLKWTPQALKCHSSGKWVKAHMTLPEGYKIENVNTEIPFVLMSYGLETVGIEVFNNDEDLVQINATFDREEFCGVVEGMEQEFSVIGFLVDGNIFYGTATFRITN